MTGWIAPQNLRLDDVLLSMTLYFRRFRDQNRQKSPWSDKGGCDG